MKILIADDSPTLRHMLEQTVRKWDYEVISASDGNDAWQLLQQEDAPRLAILDWMMPGLTGPEVCKLVRGIKRKSYVYLLLLTSRGDKEDLIEGMNAGADDYVAKPFDRSELKVRLQTGRRIVDLWDQLLAAEEELRIQAIHDALTGLRNRGNIVETLKHEMSRGSKTSGALGIILVDLDRFKRVNDTFGHNGGDAVLKVAAQRLRACLGEAGWVGRYGGEEFLAILPNVEESDLLASAEAMRTALLSEPVDVGQGTTMTVTGSFGTAIYSPGLSTEQFIHVADEALYRAKHLGRNRVEAGSATRAAPEAEMPLLR